MDAPTAGPRPWPPVDDWAGPPSPIASWLPSPAAVAGLQWQPLALREASGAVWLDPPSAGADRRLAVVDDERGLYLQRGRNAPQRWWKKAGLEGITRLDGDRVLVVAESSRRLYTVDMGGDTPARRAGRLPKVSHLKKAGAKNNGWEGISFVAADALATLGPVADALFPTAPRGRPRLGVLFAFHESDPVAVFAFPVEAVGAKHRPKINRRQGVAIKLPKDVAPDLSDGAAVVDGDVLRLFLLTERKENRIIELTVTPDSSGSLVARPIGGLTLPGDAPDLKPEGLWVQANSIEVWAEAKGDSRYLALPTAGR